MAKHLHTRELAHQLIERLERLSFRTKRVGSLIELLRLESTAAFVPYHESSVVDCESVDDLLRGSHEGESTGEFRHRSRAAWGLVLEDASECGKWRLQTFDQDGFSGHQVYTGRVDAIEAMIDQGYVSPDPGRLDELHATPRWQMGMEVLEMMRRVNSGEMTMGEFHARRSAMG